LGRQAAESQDEVPPLAGERGSACSVRSLRQIQRVKGQERKLELSHHRMSDGQRLEDTERAFVEIWSRFCGAWSRGELHERDGLTWFRTPIRHLPYNGVIRTRMDVLDEALIDDVLAGYRERGVQCFLGAAHALDADGRRGGAGRARVSPRSRR
jgi:hypothetical protein